MECSCSKKWLAFFKAVHDKNRQAILDVIQKHKTINANGIVEKIHLSQPTISHHLKILEEASVIHAKKVGKEMMYSINEAAIGECCGGFARRFAKKTT
jgi:ArsR family transcriptional regulator, arsenate/arsenite/antimonite-responsive transcriptional repressor